MEKKKVNVLFRRGTFPAALTSEINSSNFHMLNAQFPMLTWERDRVPQKTSKHCAKFWLLFRAIGGLGGFLKLLNRNLPFEYKFQ